MKSEMIKNIKEDIRKRCESPNNFFGFGTYRECSKERYRTCQVK